MAVGYDMAVKGRRQNMADNHDEASMFEAGVAFCTFLLVIFFGLKMGGAISWSWWWVFSPYWIPLVGLSIAVAAKALLERQE